MSEEVADKATAMSGYEGGPVAFTDGSYLPDTHRGGAGVVLYIGECFDLGAESGDPEPTWKCSCSADPMTGADSSDGDASAFGSAQVAGEFEAVRMLLAEAASRGLSGVTIAYDYRGVAEFYLGLQKAKTAVARAYIQDVSEFMANHPGFNLRFVWVHSHDGKSTFAQRGNDLADQLAKQGAGSTQS